MALIEESYLLHLLHECDTFIGRQEKEAKESVSKRLNEVYSILKRNIRQTFTNFSLDVIIKFTEISVELQQKSKLAEEFVDLFFERIQAPSQFYIRALLVKAKVIALNGSKKEQKGQEMLQTLKESISFISKALDLISGSQQSNPVKGKQKGAPTGDSSKSKYGFLVYNSSTCLYKITRFMLKTSWQKSFTDIFERVYRLFEELDEPNHNWRSKFTLILFQCLYDSDKKADAFKVLDSLWEKTKAKNCDFQDTLFRLRVHLSKQNGALSAVIKKDIESNPGFEWGVLQSLQRIKSGTVPEAQIEKEIMTIVNTIYDGVLSNNEQGSAILSPIKQQRLAEAGRVALKYNIISIASSITNFLSKARQPNQKAMVLNEYNKAELLIKKKGEFIDKKTGMIMSSQQIKTLEIDYRKEALKILEKVMIINKKLDSADLIYEGAVLIWNLSLPFMCPEYRPYIVKSFEISALLLEQIDSVDHDLRTKIHLELAKSYFGNEAMFIEVESNIMKAIKLDHSIALSKLQFKFEPTEDPSLYQRPYERYLEDFRQKILLKTLQNLDPTPLDAVTQDLWNVVDQKSQTTRIDILQKCLKVLLDCPEEQFQVNPDDMLVEEEIEQKKIQYERKKLRQYKRKKLLTSEVAEFAFEWELNDFSKKACEFVLADKWEAKNAVQLIIVQSKCCYFMAQIKIDELAEQNYEFPFAKCELINSQELPTVPASEEKEKQVSDRKDEIFSYLKRGLELAQSIQQYWLVFNGAIYLWNNCLHVFRNPSNDPNLKPELISLLQAFFEAMKKSLAEIESKNIVYYDLDTKIQTFANIGLMFARLKEHEKKNDEVMKICEGILATSLSPHTRKLINGIKARVQKNGGKAPDNKKGGKEASQQKAGSNDSFLLEIITQLQVIQNSTNKADSENLIKKCFESLESWKPKEQDESELELHAELWVRLARLAINEGTVGMYKYSLRCCEFSLSLLSSSVDLATVPVNRLRWYSLAEFLYSEGLLKICNPEAQEANSVQTLRLAALSKAVEAAEKGFKCNINILVLDAAKQVWNICTHLQSTPSNRFKLLKPVRTTLLYLREMKEDSEVDLVLLLSELYFRATLENKEFRAGEEMADMLLGLVPRALQKSLWEAKMVFMSKQGKNELHAISSMKEAEPSMQAKLWLKLARVSLQPHKQHTAYNKALDILKKEHSVEIVEVLLEYAEWQARVAKESLALVKSSLLLASDYLIGIEFDDDEEDAEDDERGTVFSRSTREKRSVTSKSLKSKLDRPKKTHTHKGPLSINSKASSQSRMNRSGRLAKTVKSKNNTKSIFSQKEEDPNPEALNCLHFERLFRIYATLAMVSENQEEKMRYAIESKQFLVRMYDLSLKTLNELLENTSKFAEKAEKKEGFKKIESPKTTEDWVRLEVPKEFIEKIGSLDNFDFIGTYTFEKPELTLTYIWNLLNILENYGLNLHSLPVHFMARFMSKHILGDDLLHSLANLRFKRTLVKLNHQMPESIDLSIKDLNVSETEHKKAIQKAQSSKVVQKNQNWVFEDGVPIRLVKSFERHHIWIQIGLSLILHGELSRAKVFLTKAEGPAKILGEKQWLCKIYRGLSQILYLEGQFNESVSMCLQSNQLCKSLREWPEVIIQISQTLLALKKYQNLNKYLGQIKETVVEITEETKDAVGSKEQQSNFQTEQLNLSETLLLIGILKAQAKIQEIIHDEATQENIDNFAQCLNEIINASIGTGSQILGNVGHFKFLLKVIDTTFSIFAEGGGQQCIDINFEVFKRVFELLLKFEKKVLEVNKYTLAGAQPGNTNQISLIHREYRYAIVKGCHIQEILGERDSDIAYDEEQGDVVGELGLNSEHVKKYLDKLRLEIRKNMSQIPTNLKPSETAISILQNLRPSDSESFEYVRWMSYMTLSETLRAISYQQLEAIWDQNVNIEEVSGNFGMSSLKAVNEFLDKCEPKLTNQHHPKWYQFGELAYQSLLLNTGAQATEEYFEFLAKYQHSCYTEHVIRNLKQNLSPTHRYVSSMRVLQSLEIEQKAQLGFLQSSDIVQSYCSFPTFKESMALLPQNNLIICLQLNRSKTEIYFCAFLNSLIPEERKYIVKKKTVEKGELSNLVSVKSSMNKVRKNMIKTPFEDQKKMEQTIQENQRILSITNPKFVEFNKWWIYEVVEMINKPKDAPDEPTEAAGKDKDKKAPPKDAKKKGAKDEVSAYESSLGASQSGIESITFLLDHFLYSLPFEHITGLETVPSISKDTSLFYLCRKSQKMGFQPELNNSNGFGADKGKYLGFDSKSEELNLSQILTSDPLPNLKFSGINSREKVPAPADLVSYLCSPGILALMGNVSLMNNFKPITFVECLSEVKNHLIVCSDNLNLKKSGQIKYKSLVDGKEASIEDEEDLLITVLNLLNINLVKLRWSAKEHTIKELTKSWLSKLNAGVYIGNLAKPLQSIEDPILNKSQSKGEQQPLKESEQHADDKQADPQINKAQPRQLLFEKYQTFVHGSPVLRP